MSFKNYITSLSKLQLIQLYILICICILFPYYKYIEDRQNYKLPKNQNLININKNIKNIKEKIKTQKYITIIKDIEEKSKEYKSLSIKNFNIQKNSINLSGLSKLSELLKFLIYCEDYSYTIKINNFHIKPSDKNKLFEYSIILKFENKLLPKFTKKEKKELINKIDKLTKSKYSHKIKLQAIFDNQIIINDKIFFLGDKIDTFTIKQIAEDFIILDKNNTKTKIYINGHKDD